MTRARICSHGPEWRRSRGAMFREEPITVADEAVIAIGAGSPSEKAIISATFLMQEMTGQRAKLVQLGKLDGPNDTIQLIFGSPLAVIAAAVFGSFYAAFTAELGKIAAQRLAARVGWKDDEDDEVIRITNAQPVEKLNEIARIAISEKNSLILAITNEKCTHNRNLGIEIDIKNFTHDNLYMARCIVGLSLFSKALSELSSFHGSATMEIVEDNSDLSGKIEFLQNGSTSAFIRLNFEGGAEVLKLTVDPSGEASTHVVTNPSSPRT
jgi:hypothetical protein